MKILIAAFSFSPEVNGVANVSYEHAKYFLAKGHDVTIVTQYNEKREFTEFKNIKIVEFKIKGGPLVTNFYRGENIKYINYLNKAKDDYDLLFFHGWQIWTTDLFLFTKRSKHKQSKSIFISHCSPSIKWSSFLDVCRSCLLIPYVYLIMPLLMKKFEHLIFLSDKKHGDRHQDYKYAFSKFMNKTHIIPNGIPDIPSKISPSQEISELFKSITGKKIALYVANYDQIKDQKRAVDVIKNLKMKSEVHLVFIGSNCNRYCKELILLIKKQGLDNKISVLFNVKRSDVLWFYSKSYITLFTSRTECCPLAVLESLAFNKPVVSTDVGCLNQWEGISICKTTSMLALETDLLLEDKKHYDYQKERIISSNKNNTWSSVMKGYDQFLSK
jgi:glycosyltransferase involved in cell wall biosynthesis